MEKTITLVLGIHNHQPVGNFEFVFETAYQKAYRPFLEMLARFPKIRIGLHASGMVWEWIEDSYPEYFDRVRELVDRGQIELIGGGYYEPILPSIPERDQAGQIGKLSGYLERQFAKKPAGFWLAERVWEPHLPKILARAGVRYTILDDTHFQYAGLPEEELNGYFLTEDEGRPLAVFPISKKLRYLIPFETPQKTIDHLRSLATEDGRRIAVFADDGEKFGIWPKTYEHVYEKHWLERFFTLLSENSEWLRITTFSEALERFPPAGRTYIPASSYSEMMHWALPVSGFTRYEAFEKDLKAEKLWDEYYPFVRGGFWRNFLVKYPEANRLHKKMLRVSERLDRLRSATSADDEEKLSLLEKASDGLWASQCNCPYWHGVFGGVYLNNIRYALNKALITAENFLDAAEFGDRPFLKVETIDYDHDGQSEILLEGRALNVYLDPRGGTLLELDYKDVPMNLTDVMTRREEGYHRQLTETVEPPDEAGDEKIASIHDKPKAKESDLENRLFYDDATRVSVRDRVWPEGVTLESIEQATAAESVIDDRSAWPYEVKTEKNAATVGFLKDRSINGQTVAFEKTYSLSGQKSEIQIAYRIVNAGAKPVVFLFGCEWNLTLLAGDAEDRFYYFNDKRPSESKLNGRGTVSEITSMGLVDGWQSIDIGLRFGRPASVWRYPVETISLSEDGFERVFQGSCVIPFWRINLKPKAAWDVSIHILLSRDIRRRQ